MTDFCIPRMASRITVQSSLSDADYMTCFVIFSFQSRKIKIWLFLDLQKLADFYVSRMAYRIIIQSSLSDADYMTCFVLF